jgi:hypothetical protein
VPIVEIQSGKRDMHNNIVSITSMLEMTKKILVQDMADYLVCTLKLDQALALAIWHYYSIEHHDDLPEA